MMGWTEWLVTVVLLCGLAWSFYKIGLAKSRMDPSNYPPTRHPELRAAEAIWEVTRQQGNLMLGLHDLPARMDRLEKAMSSTQSSMSDVRQSTNSMLAAFVRAGIVKTVSRDEMVGEEPPRASSGWGVEAPAPKVTPVPAKRASASESAPLT